VTALPTREQRWMARVATLTLASAGLLVIACAETDVKTLGYGTPGGPTEPALLDPDAGLGPRTEEHARSYCASDRCPTGHTTCPNSRFLCDVDLLSDPDNCGECGNACPASSAAGGGEAYWCVAGRCELTCNAERALDCDGVPDNGCEVDPLSNDNCGVCGNACPADKPCLDRGRFNFGCGCGPGEAICANPFLPSLLSCVPVDNDDFHCGACDNACPPDGDGIKVPPPNTYFGCAERKCGAIKCAGGWGDCDGIRDNGCETPVLTNDDCGACGNKCADGQRCALMLPQFIATCMCPEGQTFCGGGNLGGVEIGNCFDLNGDDDNCGACGARCANPVANAVEACIYGKCERTCHEGWADCNGNRTDGCETHVAADPKNCGACGNACDGVAGQACVDGRCMVEPCDVLQDAGDPAR